MATSIEFKRGDTAAAVKATLFSDDAGTLPLDLTGASVNFIMALDPNTPKVNSPATIVDAANGRVDYLWQAVDVDTTGTFQAEFEVTYADATVQTFPRSGYLSVTITEDLD